MHIKIIYLVKMSLETEIMFDIRFWLRFVLFGCCCQDEIKLSRNATSTKFCGTSARWHMYSSFDGFVKRRLKQFRI